MTETDEIQQVLRRQGSQAVTEMVVWTRAYRPFIMGGDVDAPIKTKVPVLGPVDAGKDFKVFLTLSPSGKIHVAESETGAFVGVSLEEVRKDIAEGDPKVMKEQIEQARKDLDRAYMLEPNAFWACFRGEKAQVKHG